MKKNKIDTKLYLDSVKKHWKNVSQTSSFLNSISDSFKQIKDYPNAILYYEAYMDYRDKNNFNPPTKIMYKDIVLLYGLNNEFEKADSFINEVLKENPPESYAYIMKAKNQVLKDSNNVELIVSNYLKYIELELQNRKSESRDNAISYVYFLIAELYMKSKNNQLATTYINNALIYNKKNEDAKKLLIENSINK